MAWGILILAGALEIVWAFGLKYTEGFTRVVPTIVVVTSIVASIALLGVAVRSIPIGTAYAIWAGMGAVGTAILGIMLHGESASPVRVLCLTAIVLGIAGLKFLGAR